MKTNLRRLERALKVFGENSFYSCAIDSSGVSLQGHWNAGVYRKAMLIKFEILDYSDSNFIRMKRGVYRITLQIP